MITQLLSKGFAPAIIKIDNRYQYYVALAKGDEDDFRNIIQMLCDSIIEGYPRALSGCHPPQTRDTCHGSAPSCIAQEIQTQDLSC